jgi:hypothetical protein
MEDQYITDEILKERDNILKNISPIKLEKIKKALNRQMKYSYFNSGKNNIKKNKDKNNKTQKPIKSQKRNQSKKVKVPYGNYLKGRKACRNNKICISCGSSDELKSDLIKYEKLVEKKPEVQNEFLIKKGETNQPINDNRFHFCYTYKKHTFGFYSYQEAMHTFQKIFFKNEKK